MSQKHDYNLIADNYMKYIDRNHDGFLSYAELTAFFDFAASKGYHYDKAQFNKMLQKYDSNGDGKFTKAELVELLKHL